MLDRYGSDLNGLLTGERITMGRPPPSPFRWGLLLSERDCVCLQAADRMACSEP
jgi:hypothetical protein